MLCYAMLYYAVLRCAILYRSPWQAARAAVEAEVATPPPCPPLRG